jgi:hypothetical protein
MSVRSHIARQEDRETGGHRPFCRQVPSNLTLCPAYMWGGRSSCCLISLGQGSAGAFRAMFQSMPAYILVQGMCLPWFFFNRSNEFLLKLLTEIWVRLPTKSKYRSNSCHITKESARHDWQVMAHLNCNPGPRASFLSSDRKFTSFYTIEMWPFVPLLLLPPSRNYHIANSLNTVLRPTGNLPQELFSRHQQVYSLL